MKHEGIFSLTRLSAIARCSRGPREALVTIGLPLLRLLELLVEPGLWIVQVVLGDPALILSRGRVCVCVFVCVCVCVFVVC